MCFERDAPTRWTALAYRRFIDAGVFVWLVRQVTGIHRERPLHVCGRDLVDVSNRASSHHPGSKIFLPTAGVIDSVPKVDISNKAVGPLGRFNLERQ